MNINDFIDELITELAYRLDSGIPDLKNKQHLLVLSEILVEWGMSELESSLLPILTENEPPVKSKEDKNYSHKAYGYYVKKGDEDKDDAQIYRKDGERYISVSKDEYDEKAKEQGELGDKSTSSGTTSQPADGGEGEVNRGTALNPNTDTGKDYVENLPEDDPARQNLMGNIDVSNLENYKKLSNTRLISGKDKTLRDIDTLNTDEFVRDIEPDDSEFNDRNKKIANPIPPEPYRIPTDLFNNPKFPKKYISVIERMMNTKPTGDGTKWSHFSDITGGAGQISAQAGELLTMIGTTLDDTDFNKFLDSLYEYEDNLIKYNSKLKPESSRIITKSWINSAKNNRRAILNRLTKQYGNFEIIASAWDTNDDVTSLGLISYDRNKAFSTDVYFKIKKTDGDVVLDEVSLKKSTVVNFLNSGAGKFQQWDDNISDDINQTVYRERQRNNLINIGNILSNEVAQILSTDSDVSNKLKSIFKSKKITFDEALSDTEKGKGSRAKSKVILESIKILANEGNRDAIQYIKNVNRMHREFRDNAINAITQNNKLKSGLLEDIKTEFPLKSISDGEETMAIGRYSLDKYTMKHIFGTSDYNLIKEKLTAEPGPPPFLGYRAEVGSNIIPIAEIAIREDGVGYGGNIKFEMKLDSRFAKLLENANKIVYGS